MKNRVAKGVISIIFLWGIFVRHVYADSSWIWLSKRKPYEIMPVVVVITILVEVLMILHLLEINNVKKVMLVVIIGNTLSFIIPYVTNYALLKTQMGYENIARAFSAGPYYIVGLGFLFLTIIIELPMVYLGLSNEIKDKKRGILVICAANILTTVLVFGIERILCYGQW